MVLVRQRSAEEGHDAVAHHLVHRAFVAMDRLHHQLQHRVDDFARLLGIAVGEQLHRPLEVGEEHCDLLALAFEGTLRREDAFGEVFGGVGGGRSPRLSRSDRRSALEAELCRRGQLCAAIWAASGERGSALLAELRLRRVVLAALGTLHRRLRGLRP